MHRWVCVLGLAVMIALAWLLSAHKRKINVRVIAGGLVLQFVFAWIVLRTVWGERFFQGVGAAFQRLLGFVEAGSSFLFRIDRPQGGDPRDLFYTFAFTVLPTIIFFASLMSILYYLGIMQLVVRGSDMSCGGRWGRRDRRAWLRRAISFWGRPRRRCWCGRTWRTMTRSELMAVMVPGFGSTAGGVLAAFVAMDFDAGHLITASVMSAPAGLLIAKVMQPEVEPAPKWSVSSWNTIQRFPDRT